MQLVVFSIVGFGILILIGLYRLNVNMAGYLGEVYRKLSAEHSTLKKQLDAVGDEIEELRKHLP
jgi:hypothetical protein